MRRNDNLRPLARSFKRFEHRAQRARMNARIRIFHCNQCRFSQLEGSRQHPHGSERACRCDGHVEAKALGRLLSPPLRELKNQTTASVLDREALEARDDRTKSPRNPVRLMRCPCSHLPEDAGDIRTIRLEFVPGCRLLRLAKPIRIDGVYPHPRESAPNLMKVLAAAYGRKHQRGVIDRRRQALHVRPKSTPVALEPDSRSPRPQSALLSMYREPMPRARTDLKGIEASLSISTQQAEVNAYSECLRARATCQAIPDNRDSAGPIEGLLQRNGHRIRQERKRADKIALSGTVTADENCWIVEADAL